MIREGFKGPRKCSRIMITPGEARAITKERRGGGWGDSRKEQARCVRGGEKNRHEKNHARLPSTAKSALLRRAGLRHGDGSERDADAGGSRTRGTRPYEAGLGDG